MNQLNHKQGNRPSLLIYLQIDNSLFVKMYVDKIRETFQRCGYVGSSIIRRQHFYQIMNTLMKTPSPFDREVADQLWDQASGGSSSINIMRVCETINDGISILIVKLQEVNQDIKLLERERLQIGNTNYRTSLTKVEGELQELRKDRQDYEQQLKIVTIPFGINPNNTRASGVYYPTNQKSGNNSLYQSGVSTGDISQKLSYILYLSIIYLAIEIIIIYEKNDFLNLIVVTCLLSIYLLNHFDNLYIKFTLALLALSEFLDIIWLLLQAGDKWDPPKVGNESTVQLGYLRFVVVFVICLIAIKVPIGYFLYLVKNANDNKYELSMGMFKLIINANKSNPITRNLNSALST